MSVDFFFAYNPFPNSNYAFGPHPWGGETLNEAAAKWLVFTALTAEDKPGLLTIERDYVLRKALENIRLLYPKRYPIEVSIRVGELKKLLGEHEFPVYYCTEDRPWQGKTLKETAEKWLKYVGLPTVDNTKCWTERSCSNFRDTVSAICLLYPTGHLPTEIASVCDVVDLCVRHYESRLFNP
jgi:hypothetical protein